MKFHWFPGEAIISAVIATVGVSGIDSAHPDLHPVAYAVGWLVLAGVLYQTGSELSERRRGR